MSIVALDRLTLIGPAADKEPVLSRLQALGCLHLVALGALAEAPERQATPHAERTLRALYYLVGTSRKRRPVIRVEGFDLEVVTAQVLENRDRLREAEDRRDALGQRIAALTPWGDFRLPPPEDLAGYRLWFYVLPAGRLDWLRPVQTPWQIVHRDHRQAYVVLLAREEPLPDVLPVPRVHSGAKSLGALELELEDTEVLIEGLWAEREALTRWLGLIRRNLDRAEDRAALVDARNRTWERDGLFVVQGWAPREAREAITAFADAAGLACLAEPPGPADRPPTLYRNPPAVAGGQDLVDFYQTPGYHGWDPSSLVFFSFAMFFAMILSDAGYAALLGLGLIWKWRALGESGRGQRLRTLGLALVLVSLAYGVLAGSFFGAVPADGTLLGRLHLLDLHDMHGMMRLSILVGALHVILANGLAAWNQRGRTAALPPLGWVSVTLGGVALWLAPAGSALHASGWLAGGLGLALVLLFSAPGPWRPAGALVRRLLKGLLSASRLSQLFGDVLSYMRLFALGLASASLAVTFNDLARQVQAAMPGFGVLFSLLILVLGHSLNLGLAVMSGVVHGLRLNFIEFFNWGISEEGYPFKPFMKKENTHG